MQSGIFSILTVRFETRWLLTSGPELTKLAISHHKKNAPRNINTKLSPTLVYHNS